MYIQYKSLDNITIPIIQLKNGARAKQLKEHNVPYHNIIFGLPHCQRVIINDFNDSNLYPSAVAINLKRDNDDLHLFIH